MNERYGAMPVPVATMIRSTFGSFSGISITLPEGPVSATSSPGLVSHRKLEHTPAPRQRRGSCWSRAAQHRAAVLAHRTRARCAA